MMPVVILDVIRNLSPMGAGIVLVSFLATLLSGIVFWQDMSKRSNKFFLFFGLIVGVWGMAYAFFDGTLGTPAIHASISLFYLSMALIPPFIFLYIYVFSSEKSSLSFWNLTAIFMPYLLLGSVLLIKPDFIVKYTTALDGVSGTIVFGKWYPLYVLYFAGFLLSGITVLIKKYRESVGVFKITTRNFFVAFFTAYTVVVFTTLVYPFFTGGHSLFWVGHTSIIVLAFATVYILSGYNFWSVKVIATEFFISVIAVVLVVELFLATSILDLAIKTGITLLVIFSSSFLVGSVRREMQSKDKITRLVHDLGIMAKQLKFLDKKKSEFLSVASHHLRDPLTAIRGYASMLDEGSFGELPVGVREAVDKIFESSKRLITMVSDFLDISRIESGDMRYEFSDVDMKKIVLDLEYEMKLNADKAHINFSVTVDEHLKDKSFVTVGDAGKLRQVISNLIDNSIKYTPRGEVSALLSKSSDGKKIIFSVSDTGIGMSPSTLDKIFRKFSRAEGVSKVYTEGTGLGLYVAKEIVKKHEGKIWAESKGEGLGSSFYVELEAKQ